MVSSHESPAERAKAGTHTIVTVWGDLLDDPGAGAMISAMKRFLLRFQLFQDLREGRAQRRRRETGIGLPVIPDYPFQSVPRYGHGRAPHGPLSAILERQLDDFVAVLREFRAFGERLARIPLDAPPDASRPYWRNQYFAGLDAVSLYAFAGLYRPRQYIEVGSGNSTKFMRQAVKDHNLGTYMTSIDPKPRVEIDQLCDEVRRTRLEDVDVALFDKLAAGDMLLVDGSHRTFMNSDVTVVFLDVLPRLKPGVLIYFDDIFLPLDYPREWIDRYYSEQYLLAVELLAEGPHLEVILPCTFVRLRPQLKDLMDSMERQSGLTGAGWSWGSGFWLRRR
ncbi:MAG TPA: class I SAM-dependent methyltransferase [Methylomirabilota bacterium]